MDKKRVKIGAILVILASFAFVIPAHSFPPDMKRIWNHDGPIMSAGWEKLSRRALPAPYLKIVNKDFAEGTAYKLKLGEKTAIYVFRRGSLSYYRVEYLIIGVENLKTKQLSDAYVYTEDKENTRGPNMGVMEIGGNSKPARQILMVDLYQQPGSGIGGVTEQFYFITPKPSLIRCFVLPTDEWNWFPKQGKDMVVRAKRHIETFSPEKITVSIKVLEGFDYPLKLREQKTIEYIYDNAEMRFKPADGIKQYPLITVTSGSYREMFLQGGIGVQDDAGLTNWTSPNE